MAKNSMFVIVPRQESAPGAVNGPPIHSLVQDGTILELTTTHRFELVGCTPGPKSLRPCSAIATEVALPGVGRIRLSAPLILPSRGVAEGTWASVADPELRAAIVTACQGADKGTTSAPAKPEVDPEAAAEAARRLMGR